MIWEKTGAATVPPNIGVGRSRTTISESVGLLAGANPTKDGQYRHPARSCPGPGWGSGRPGLAGHRVTRHHRTGARTHVDNLLEHARQLRVGRGRKDPVAGRRRARGQRAARRDCCLDEPGTNEHTVVCHGVCTCRAPGGH